MGFATARRFRRHAGRRLKAGDHVRLRPPHAILDTLDAAACLDGVPFMPEMLRYYGRTYRVLGQVERACDTIGYSGVRRLTNTVMLDDLRCDGAAHAGCQAECRIFWKEAWLERVDDDSPAPSPGGEGLRALEERAVSGVTTSHSTHLKPVFRCQATELLRGSEPVGWWSIRSFWHELASGNVGIGRFVRVISRIVVDEVRRRAGLLSELPFGPGHSQPRGAVPAGDARIAPGQLVQIRSGREIAATLDARGKNKGLWFDREMTPYCGRTARVRSKVERFIDERSGELVELASDCYILEGVVCDSARSSGRWFCPRAIYPWWREAWLAPVEERTSESG